MNFKKLLMLTRFCKYLAAATISIIATCLFTSVAIVTQARADEAHGEIKVNQLAKTTMQWDGQQLPPYPNKNPEITILSYEIPPGMKLPMHKHPVINAGVVLQGTLTVISQEGKQLILNSGDSIVELVNRWHYGVNQGSEPVKIIVFYAGEAGVPLVVKE
jgi:quercetin dioxygenase-like cupin family protein